MQKINTIIIEDEKGGHACPACGSLRCYHSRPRGMENFWRLFIPFIQPYRCHACNWRGYIGAFGLLRAALVNPIFNAFLFLSIVTVVVLQLLSVIDLDFLP